MSSSITDRGVVSIGGLSITSVATRSIEGSQPGLGPYTLAAADAGSLTTRASDTAGTLTMTSEDHGISTGDVIDIFWTDANSRAQCAYGCTVGTVSTTSVPFTGASFDTGTNDASVLPAQDTSVTADEQTEIIEVFDGDNLEFIILHSTRKGHFEFEEAASSGGSTICSGKLTANEAWRWISDQGITNPLTGQPVQKIKVSNGDSSNSATLKGGYLHDNVT